jgi:hypothetical protein
MFAYPGFVNNDFKAELSELPSGHESSDARAHHNHFSLGQRGQCYDPLKRAKVNVAVPFQVFVHANDQNLLSFALVYKMIKIFVLNKKLF